MDSRAQLIWRNYIVVANLLCCCEFFLGIECRKGSGIRWGGQAGFQPCRYAADLLSRTHHTDVLEKDNTYFLIRPGTEASS